MSLLDAHGVAKVYAGTVALHPSDFTVAAGTIHGVLGKNGAGKSTLLGILAGSVAPTSGRVEFDGADVTDLDLAERQAAGIRMLDQHAQVVGQLSVAENLLTPDLPRRRGFVHWAAVRARASEQLEQFDLDLDPAQPAGQLGTADQRKLNIVRALSGNTRLVMLDEPTTALTRLERQALFDWVRRLRDQGRTFVFISHYLQEVRELCDAYTIVRDGRLVSTHERDDGVSAAELSTLVTGEEVDVYRRSHDTDDAPTRLTVRQLRPAGCEPLDLSVREGEIVGLVGLTGSGAGEVARSLVGLHEHDVAEVRVGDRQVRTDSVAHASAGGIVYLTHDRHGEGIVPMLSARENAYLGRWPHRGSWLDRAAMRTGFGALREHLSLRLRDPEQPVRELSGGNQQKVLIARLLQHSPDVLVLHEPTLGVDVLAKEEVHRLVGELADKGTAVLLLAYDTDELIALCDRALVFHDGRLTEELSGDDLHADTVHDALEGTT